MLQAEFLLYECWRCRLLNEVGDAAAKCMAAAMIANHSPRSAWTFDVSLPRAAIWLVAGREQQLSLADCGCGIVGTWTEGGIVALFDAAAANDHIEVLTIAGMGATSDEAHVPNIHASMCRRPFF